MNIRVELRDVDGVEESLEKKLDAAMESEGLQFSGSGYNFKTRVRDLAYEKKE